MMTQESKRKRTPEELFDAIEESDATDEAERILGLADEALDKELAAAGFDPTAVARRGRGIAEQAMRGAVVSKKWEGRSNGPSARIEPTKARWRMPAGRMVLIAAALGAAAVGAVVGLPALVAQRGEGQMTFGADASGTTLTQTPAGALRDRALRACEDQQWKACVADLSAARAIDPMGDTDERVQAAWKRALEALPQPNEPDGK